MARFVIRNYGPTRQVPYQNTQIYIARDGAMETDNENIAATMKGQKDMTVTDHGVQSNPAPSEEPKQKGKDKKRQITVDKEPVPKEDPVEKVTPEVVSEEVVSEEAEEIAYEEMTVKELQVLAKDRQLTTSGLLKAELIQALTDYDAED